MDSRADQVNRAVDRLLSRAEQAELAALVGRGPGVLGRAGGMHRSPRHGHGYEFHDYRRYAPGDPMSRIDWRLFGRTDRLFIQRRRHEAEIPLHLLVDCSASMDFSDVGGARRATRGGITKWRAAQRLAAALAWLAAGRGDPISASCFAAEPRSLVTRGQSVRHLAHFMGELARIDPGGRTDPLAVADAAKQLHVQGGLAVVISDFLEPAGQWCQALQPLRRRRLEVVCCQILTRPELDLGGIDTARLVDAERGDRRLIDARQIASAYRVELQRHQSALGEGMQRAGAAFRLFRADTPVVVIAGELMRPLWPGR